MNKSNSRKHHILYHMDSDGHAAGAVVYKYLLDGGAKDEDILWHPINYGMPIPSEIDRKKDMVYMVDFSLQPLDAMVEFALSLGDNLTWIDHHQTSVDMEDQSPVLKDVAGVRRVDWNGVLISGCELVWQYFMGSGGAPRLGEQLSDKSEVLRLVGDYDTWRWSDYGEKRQEEVQSFQYFLGSFSSDPGTEGGREWWLRALDACGETVVSWCKGGRVLREYQQKQWHGVMKSKGFEADFQGLRAVMMNQTASSQMFDGFFDPEKHDVMVAFQLVKGKYLTVSMYTTKTDEFHLGKLAKKLGEAGDMPSGGGHAGAAGFQCSWDYFSGLFDVKEDE